MMRRLLQYFLRGLIFLAPVVVTLYVCWALFVRVDRWLGLPIPGAGFVATVALVTLVGFLASNFLTRSLLGWLDGLLERLPFVRLLYSSTRDLLNAFVGERRRFDRPVLVELVPGAPMRALGFVTQGTLDVLGLAGYVAVYLPQSYNVAGNLLFLPASAVTPVPLESAEVMAFIVSGGVTELMERAAAALAPAADAD